MACTPAETQTKPQATSHNQDHYLGMPEGGATTSCGKTQATSRTASRCQQADVQCTRRRAVNTSCQSIVQTEARRTPPFICSSCPALLLASSIPSPPAGVPDASERHDVTVVNITCARVRAALYAYLEHYARQRPSFSPLYEAYDHLIHAVGNGTALTLPSHEALRWYNESRACVCKYYF